MQHGMGMTRQDEPFASRESALRALTALLDDDAPRRVAVVEGPPGIGKSRLLRDWARLAAASGREVHGAYGALAYRTVPYGMLLDAVQETGAAEVLARASADHPDDRATRHRTHLRVAKAVRAALAAPKAAVVLDDVQWSDTESLAVLERLVRMPGHAGAPVFVLAYRQGECPDGLARTLSSANAQHLPLPPLDEAETARMLPGTSPGDRALLARLSRGNPRHLRLLSGLPPDRLAELAESYPHHGGRPGAWEWSEPARPVQRRTLRGTSDATAIRWEFDGLPGPTLQVLASAAVLGPEVTPREVAAVAELPPEDVTAQLDLLVQRGCLEVADCRFRFVYPLGHLAAYRQFGPAWRAAAHRRAAAHLMRHSREPASWAAHLEQALPEVEAQELAQLARAAVSALPTTPELSKRWLSKGLHAMKQQGGELPLRDELAIDLGRALAVRGEFVDARKVLRPALAASGAPGRQAQALLALMDRLQGRTDSAYEVLADLTTDAAPETVPPTPGPGGRHLPRADLPHGDGAELQLARIELMNGRVKEAARRAEVLRAGATDTEESLGPTVLAAMCALAGGDTDTARRGIEDAARLWERLSGPGRLRTLSVVPEFGWSGFFLERYEKAKRRLDTAVDAAGRHGQHYLLPHLHTLRACLYGTTDDLAEAVAAADTAMELSAASGSTEMVALAAAFRLRPLLWSRGTEAAGEGLALLRTLPEPPVAWWRAALVYAEVEVGIACGRRPTGAETVRLLGLGDTARPDPMLAYRCELAASVYAEEGDEEAVADLVRRAGESADALGLRGARAAADQARARLLILRKDAASASEACEAAAAGFEGAGQLVRAGQARVLAACCASLPGGPADGGHGAASLAAGLALFEKAGARALVAAAGADGFLPRTVAALRRRPVLPWPGVPDGVPKGSGAGRLSPREREIADLVANGLSNRATARQLFVSVRTVETHLTSVYQKLGIRSRAALARALDRHDGR
ncbi:MULTISPECIES: AAA family ATPase [unclassified Streptomyces]|uniref:helix-turn-helix transcriptional regulator n=2 Tax=unclassified Streptomyces TaxID=2593676 RepID=UPI00386956D1|nr:AAA family ATPase [Streptomyces sp. NBC_00890]WSZ23693.1 AAA family ATPase [Streptomyces sp. NBC_00870]